ncbi:MAG: NFACT family protein [Candidatus Verstraetearchaeota archaeon]|nr:NFACT family protein [Candidatus Verstraetearchaeota archaeon]
MKTALSSLDILAVVKELRDRILGYRVINIYQLNPQTFLLKLYAPGSKASLLIEAGRRLHLTEFPYKPPEKPTTLAMSLRKYLSGAKLIDVKQKGFDRLVEFRFQSKQGFFTLIAELFREGNLILLNGERRILHALYYKEMRDRSIKRGFSYSYPPSSQVDVFSLTSQLVLELAARSKLDVVRFLARELGLSGEVAEELCARCGLEKHTPANSLSQETAERLVGELQGIFRDIAEGRMKPHIVMEEGRCLDLHPVEFKSSEADEILEYSSFNEAVDHYFWKIGEQLKTAERELKERLEALQRTLRQQQEYLEKLLKDSQHYKALGDCILRNMHQLDLLIKWLRENRHLPPQELPLLARRELEELTATLKRYHPQSGEAVIEVDGLEVPLNIRLSASESAQHYYTKYKECLKKIEGLRRAIEETEKQLESLTEAREAIEEASKYRLAKREWYEKFRWFISSEGFLVLGGKDATQNEVLGRHYLTPHDIFVHADVPGGSVVIVKTEGRTPSEATLKEAAQFAAAYSKAWSAGLGSVDVYWAMGSQVSKTPPSGEYLGKGAFMVYGERHYFRGVPLRLAIGIVVEEEVIKVIGGPLSAVSAKTQLMVEITPGKTPSRRLAEQIRNALKSRAPRELQPAIDAIPLEEFQRFIPAGGGAISISKRQRLSKEWKS